MALATPLRALEQLGQLAQLGQALPLRPAAERSPAAALRELLPRGITHEGIVLEQHIREGRFQRSLALIAGLSSILSGLEVATEHYRGSYSQRIMFSPIFISPALTIAGVWAVFDRRIARTLLPATSLAAMVDGIVGFLFHIRGIHRKPGGWRIPVFNIIMGPPIFAPLLFGISGFLGLIASLLRREDAPRQVRIPGIAGPRPWWVGLLPRAVAAEGLTIEQDVREGRFQQGLAVAAALSALLNGSEALYSHYKNNFTYTSQWTPILLTPVIMAAGFGAAVSRSWARTLLPVVSLLAIADGTAGFLYHLRGLLRRPGALRYPIYSLTYGPPIFAPLLFAATGFLGVLASLLRRAK